MKNVSKIKLILVFIILQVNNFYSQEYNIAPNNFRDIDQSVNLPFFSFGAHSKLLISWYHTDRNLVEWMMSNPKICYNIGINVKVTPIKYISFHADIDFERNAGGVWAYDHGYMLNDYYNASYEIKTKESFSYIKLPLKISYNYIVDNFGYAYIGVGVYGAKFLYGRYSYSYVFDKYSFDTENYEINYEIIEASIKKGKLPEMYFMDTKIDFSQYDYGYLFFIGGVSKVKLTQYYWELNVNIGKKGIYTHDNEWLKVVYAPTTKIKSLGMTIGFYI